MTTPIENFGRNVRFQPQAHYVPTSEDEVLDILDQHRGTPIRVIGRMHSWSRILETPGVLIDLRKLDSVAVDESDNAVTATVGAGCQVQHLLHTLRRFNATLPSVGLIDEQCVAGAISTGTHGSGKHKLHIVTTCNGGI